jgi:hypothetical protein
MNGRCRIAAVLALLVAPCPTGAAAGRPDAMSSAPISTGPQSQENPALADLRQAAQLGDLQAQYNLAVMYDTGRGVAQSYRQAVTWYRKAAEGGLVRAQYNLAHMYADGLGVRQSDTQAAAWYRKAADLGDAPAQYNLATMYENGRGVPRDYQFASSWYRKAADQSYAAAMYNLGAMYYRGQGVELDYVEAYKWRRLAAAYSPADKRNTYADSAEAVTRFMTPQQVAESEQRVRDWTVAFETRSRSENRVAPAAPARSSPAPTRPQRAFKSSIDLVEVETTVVNADAMQVRDRRSTSRRIMNGCWRPSTASSAVRHPCAEISASHSQSSLLLRRVPVRLIAKGSSG